MEIEAAVDHLNMLLRVTDKEYPYGTENVKQLSTAISVLSDVLSGRLVEAVTEEYILSVLYDVYGEERGLVGMGICEKIAHALVGKVAKPSMSREDLKSIIRCIDFSPFERGEMSKGKFCEVIADALSSKKPETDWHKYYKDIIEQLRHDDQSRYKKALEDIVKHTKSDTTRVKGHRRCKPCRKPTGL